MNLLNLLRNYLIKNSYLAYFVHIFLKEKENIKQVFMFTMEF